MAGGVLCSAPGVVRGKGGGGLFREGWRGVMWYTRRQCCVCPLSIPRTSPTALNRPHSPRQMQWRSPDGCCYILGVSG